MTKHLFVFVAALCGTTPALAHVVLEPRPAYVGGYTKFVFQVGHGCDGAATTGITVQIPEGLIAAKPMPKPGWTAATKSGAYAQAHSHHGHAVSEGVREITWTGTLSDAEYDEFVVFGQIAPTLEAGAAFVLPVVQRCGKTESRWVEVPKDGETRPDFPAPMVRLQARP